MNRYKIMVVLLTAGMFDAVFAHGLFLLADFTTIPQRYDSVSQFVV